MHIFETSYLSKKNRHMSRIYPHDSTYIDRFLDLSTQNIVIHGIIDLWFFRILLQMPPKNTLQIQLQWKHVNHFTCWDTTLIEGHVIVYICHCNGGVYSGRICNNIRKTHLWFSHLVEKIFLYQIRQKTENRFCHVWPYFGLKSCKKCVFFSFLNFCH